MKLIFALAAAGFVIDPDGANTGQRSEGSGLYGEMQPQQYSCRGRHAGAGHCPSRESLYRRLPQGSGRES